MSQIKLISCPSCQTPNRVPFQKLSDKPVCGRCRELLFQGKPVELDAARFDKLIKSTDIPVVVDFWAPWCGPCKMMGPVFTQVAAQLEPKFRFVKVNTEVEQALAARYAVRSIPTLLMIKDGKEIARQAGAVDATSLMRWLQMSV
ncbi:thioredoxin TrxC [Neptunomonas antarctica]|uniref:Thioredoxin n=1 Tax=Neptunomonas antarctica TaxID=619304 RepID=A0A1N7KJW0_9GAMM|nr:thioredoxin TrxC [Neptunomonas antarctica]SIS61902.1 thioredoxin [Neptunomonas antarctica]